MNILVQYWCGLIGSLFANGEMSLENEYLEKYVTPKEIDRGLHTIAVLSVTSNFKKKDVCEFLKMTGVPKEEVDSFYEDTRKFYDADIEWNNVQTKTNIN